MRVQIVRPEELRLTANGPGVPGQEGVIYQAPRNGSTMSRTYIWNGERHVQFGQPEVEALVSEVRIAVLADSLTAQSPLLDEMWPSVLERSLQQSGAPVRVRTFAVNGWTAFTTMNSPVYGSKTTFQACMDYNPQILIVALGFNDAYGAVRTPTQINADIVTLLTNARAALPNALIYFADQGVYDQGNFPNPAVTLKNKALPPQVWSLNTAGILTNTYTTEILETAPLVAVRDATAAWVGYVNAARALSPTIINGFFSLKAWFIGRLGFTTADRLHPTRVGQMLIAGAALKGLSTQPAVGALLPNYGNQQKTSWIDPDVVFSENMTTSADGYVGKTPNANESEAAIRHWSQISRELRPNSWFYPYKATVIFKPLTGPTGNTISIGTGFYQLQITGAAPLSAVAMSIDGGAFVAIGESTDEAGNLWTTGNMQALATTLSAAVGTRTLRIGMSNGIGLSSSAWGPQTLTLTA